MSTLTAIELGTKTLTAVQVRANGQGAEIVRSGAAEVAAVDAESVRRALEKCGVSAGRALLVVQRSQAILRDIELPVGTPDELVAMVRFQVERDLPLPLDKVRYSFVETARANGKVRLLVAAVPRDILDPAVAAVEGAGVKVAGAYVSSFGLMALYRDVAALDSARGGPAVLVEVADGEAEILVVDQGRMEFSRTASLAEDSGADKVAEEVNRTLLAYAAKAPGKAVGKVVLAGEGPAAAELAQALRARLDREVAQAGPGDLGTACVAGLCVGLARGVSMPDLLHPPVAAKKFRFTRLHRVVGLAILALAMLVVWSQVSLSDKRQLLERRRGELKKLEPQVAALNRIRQDTVLAQQWYRDRNAWLKTLEDLGKHMKTDNLWILSASFDDTGAIRLTGKMRDGKYARDLVTALQNTNHFEDVSLPKDAANNDKGEYRKDFVITAHLAGFGAKKKKP